MIYYTLRKVQGTWSLFVLLPDGDSLAERFDEERQAFQYLRQFAVAWELTEAEMWRETMRRELAVAHV